MSGVQHSGILWIFIISIHTSSTCYCVQNVHGIVQNKIIGINLLYVLQLISSGCNSHQWCFSSEHELKFLLNVLKLVENLLIFIKIMQSKRWFWIVSSIFQVRKRQIMLYQVNSAIFVQSLFKKLRIIIVRCDDFFYSGLKATRFFATFYTDFEKMR